MLGVGDANAATEKASPFPKRRCIDDIPNVAALVYLAVRCPFNMDDIGMAEFLKSPAVVCSLMHFPDAEYACYHQHCLIIRYPDRRKQHMRVNVTRGRIFGPNRLLDTKKRQRILVASPRHDSEVGEQERWHWRHRQRGNCNNFSKVFYIC